MTASDDDSIEPTVDDEAFEEDLYRATSHTETDKRLLDSLQLAKDQIQSFTADEFVTEAFTAATNLRNVMGDADGFAYELCELIRSNLMVVVQAINKDPGEFVLAAARTIESDAKRVEFLERAKSKINGFLASK